MVTSVIIRGSLSDMPTCYAIVALTAATILAGSGV
jgi:hypothetical protein